MLTTLSRNWWSLVLRGVLAILFGILAFTLPGLTVGSLVLLFGVYALLDGIFSLVSAVRGHVDEPRWMLLLEGVAGIVAGILTFAWPGITLLVLLYLIAAWAVVTGIAKIIAAVRLRQTVPSEVLLVLSGIASVVFGVLVMFWPFAGILAVAWIIGFYALIFGALLIALGVRVHRLIYPPVPSR